MTTPPVVDSGALDRLTEWGGDKLLRQMLRLFLENAKERLEQVRAGLAPGGDLDEAHRSAHALKSSAANLGAMQVSALSAELEASTGAGDLERSRQLADALVEAHAAADAALTRVLESLP